MHDVKLAFVGNTATALLAIAQEDFPDVVHLYSEGDFREATVSARGFRWSEAQQPGCPTQVRLCSLLRARFGVGVRIRVRVSVRFEGQGGGCSG